MRAFTLIELMISLAIAMILLFVAVPTFTGFMAKNASAKGAEQIVAALQLTRMEAIHRGEQVAFCKNGDWSNGQIITSQNGTILRTFSIVTGKDKLIWQSSLGHNDSITFQPTGIPNGQQGSFYYCPSAGAQYALAVIIEEAGRIRISDQSAPIFCNALKNKAIFYT